MHADARITAAILAALLLSPIASARESALNSELNVIPHAVASAGYAEVAREVRSTGSFLGVSPERFVASLFTRRSDLTRAEAESLLLMLLRFHAGSRIELRRPLVLAVMERVPLLHDWTLLAMALRQAVEVRLPSRDTALCASAVLAVSMRILATLEEEARAGPSSRNARNAGYESAALAAALTARELAQQIEPAARLELAELLRSIARLSRSRDVVRQLDRAVRVVLGVSDRRAPVN